MVHACSTDELTISLKIIDTIHATNVQSIQYVKIKPSDNVRELFENIAALYLYDAEAFELILQNKTGDTTVLNDFKSHTVTHIPFTFKTDGSHNIVTLNSIRGVTMHKQSKLPQQPRVNSDAADSSNKTAPAPPADSSASSSWLGSTVIEGAVALGQGSVDVDDMSLGASASPTADGGGTDGDGGPSSDGDDAENGEASSSSKDRSIGGAAGISHYFDTDSKHYVGLVNQAMTCYLNSLLQALYNTPEFRNALYKWEYDEKLPEKQSIPFQLQKLFVNLQTSTRTAVETTDLTQSFGWGMQNAWEQHDIQELCRVMFDALERTFRDTTQANLINDLYEGTMLDYVKCLECGREKSREDTFLDIPLPVRPFNSPEAYHSIEEALRAFVQPETLDGNNQYHCENCDKKCDAHKGLKFIKLPYLLTLHLKRFDFDYSTMHRIKLNDKVVFKQKLNLNSFVTGAKVLSEEVLTEERDNTVKFDDCSTTDYGSALDDESCQGTDLSSSANYTFDNCQDDDEGIDVSSGNNSHENEKNRRLQEPKGPYSYELFSIMIHSGSASGGHYYAYIKDFDKGNWYCYNDTSVTTITEEDIRKTYGGGPSRSGGYYSGAYTSSTNAYMLMYRQVDEARNANVLSVEQFPTHIAQIAREIKNKEESDRIAREQETSLHKIKVYCYHPSSAHQSQLFESRHCVLDDNSLGEIARDAHAKFALDSYSIRLEDCRLVSYNRTLDLIVRSWSETDFYGEVENELNGGRGGVFGLDAGAGGWLLEIRERGKEWIVYDPSDVSINVYLINIDTEEIDDHVVIRCPRKLNAVDLQNRIMHLFPCITQVDMALKTNCNSLEYIIAGDVLRSMMMMEFDCSKSYKLFVSQYKEVELNTKSHYNTKLYSLILEKFEQLMSVILLYPETTIGMLNDLTIPSLDAAQTFERAIDMGAGGDRHSPQLRTSPQPTTVVVNCTAITNTAVSSTNITATDTFGGDHSNSEDSSLSDSDRTLVGDAPGDCFAMMSSNSNSMPDVHLSSPTASDNIIDEPPTNPDLFNKTLHYDRDQQQNLDEAMSPTVNTDNKHSIIALRDYYFKAEVLPILNLEAIIQASSSSEITCGVITRCCRILADKRISLRSFKQHLGTLINVPADYFKLFRQQHQQIGSQPNETEWNNPHEHLETNGVECERIVARLARNIREGEYAVSVHQLVIDSPEPSSLLFDWIIGNGQLVSVVKKDILQHAKKHHMLDIPYTRARLRKKSYKTPQKVYLDDQKFGEDIPLRYNQNNEIFLERLPEDENMTSQHHLSIFLRRWSPSTYYLGPMHQATLSPPTPNATATATVTLGSIRQAVSVASGIPAEEVELAKVRAAFPADMNATEVQGDLEWCGVSVEQDAAVWDDGTIFFYRDHREEAKELTSEERKELCQRENTRLGTCNATRHKYNQRRQERALKIYLPGSSPSGSRDESMNVD